MVLSGGQICNHCKLCYLVAKFAINASSAMLLPSSIKVTESISGSVVPLAMFKLKSINNKHDSYNLKTVKIKRFSSPTSFKASSVGRMKIVNQI